MEIHSMFRPVRRTPPAKERDSSDLYYRPDPRTRSGQSHGNNNLAYSSKIYSDPESKQQTNNRFFFSFSLHNTRF